jgi:hypothetical protein
LSCQRRLASRIVALRLDASLRWHDSAERNSLESHQDAKKTD